jgi:hypothetical protein
MNILIVESKNDKAYIEAVIRHLSLKQVEVNNPICQIDDFDCMNGLNETKLTASLKDALTGVMRGVEKIGVLIDLDKNTVESRLKMVNDSLKAAFESVLGVEMIDKIENINDFLTITTHDSSVSIACYFTNVDGEGELETVLKAIKTQDSPFADCLDEWQRCLKDKGKDISQKDFDKFWLSNYVRFDTCSRNDRKQSERKCSIQNLDYVLENKPTIFDFDNTILHELKTFLKLFS